MEKRLKSRCTWAESDPALQKYHDEEWGVPERESRALWEKLMLDGFQAGLSWRTILMKRAAFRRAFRGFRPKVVAAFTSDDVDTLLQDAGIVRSRAKIEATIRNAQAYETMRRHNEHFSDFCWQFVDHVPLVGDGRGTTTKSALSETISRALKQRGFSFVGPTIVYAWMQAVGLVNDHTRNCFLFTKRSSRGRCLKTAERL